MSTTENRVVRMQFDNAQFKKAAGDTQKQLTDIDKAVANAGKGRGLMDMAKGMEQVSIKAGAMQVGVVTAIATIVNKAVDAGLRIAKSLTLDPLKAGFDEYELKMKSIQTILANTKGESLQTVSAALNELNKYSDKTIYNFAAMTSNIGQMTTAGIDLETATATVKGFSNMAALAGGDANAAAGAMVQFSQGLQAGKITAMDWMSLSTRGLGSQALQKAFFETARVAGTLTDVPVGQTFEEWSKASGGFKGSLEKGWLTSDVATKALANMTGDVKTVQELMKQGYSRKAAEDLLEIADNAFESATKVRTLSSFMGTLKEQVGSGFAQVFEQIFGDFNQATNLFSRLSNFTGNALNGIFKYITKMAQAWRELGGRAAILKTFQNILAPIGAILKVISAAWTAAFGRREAGSGLASLSKGLRNITKPLQTVADIIEGSIGPITFFFRLLKIGKVAVVELFGALGDLVGKAIGLVDLKAPSGDGGFIGFIKDIAKQIADAVKKVSNLLDKGKSLKEAFGKVDFDLPELPSFGSISMPSFGGMGQDLPTSKFALMAETVENLTGNLGVLNGFSLDKITGETDGLAGSLSGAETDSKSLGDKLGGFFSSLKDGLAAGFKKFDLNDLMASLNLAVLATFVISLSRMMNTFSKTFETFMGTGEAANKLIDGAGGALKSFQTQANAKLILNIAIALGILAVSLWLLSRIPQDKLFKALAALAGAAAIMSVAMGSLTTTMETMTKKGTGVKMLVLGATMVLFAIAISILASAMKKMNDVDWGSVIKAGVAMYGLTKAMEALSSMKSDGILKTAFALIVVSAALWLFAVAIKKFSGLDLLEFAEGMAMAAISLGTLVFMLKGFQSSLAGAAAMVVVTVALWLLVDVIEKFAGLDWGTFGKGLLFISASLVVLVLALYMFESSLAGAAALVVAVGALWLMVDVISAFAALDWSTFGKGLAMFAITMVTLGAIMALMGVFSPLILLGAAAILIFGAAMFLLGTGIMFLAKGLGALILIAGGVVAAISTFAIGAAVGIGIFLQTLALQAPIMKDSILKILQALIDTIVGAVPMIIKGIKDLWNAVMKELGGDKKGGGSKGASMQAAGKGWMDRLKDGIKGMMPQIVTMAVDLLVQFIEGLSNNTDKLVAAGINFVVKLLNGISENMGKITAAGAGLVLSFLEGLEGAWDKIITRAIMLMGEFLHDLADAIRLSSSVIGGGITDVLDAMHDVGVDMVQGLINGVVSMMSAGDGAIGDLATSMINKAKDMFKIFSPSRVFKDIGEFLVEGLTKGVQDHAASAISAVASMVGGQIAVATAYVSEFIQKLDQQSIAASAKAAGLAKAAQLANQKAEEATKKAEKTKKNKKDDKRAKELTKDAKQAQKKADRAAKAAEKADDRVAAATAKRERAEQFRDSTLLEKADMRSEDAQNQLDAAKQAELNAAAKRAEAHALREAAKTANDKDAKKMRKQADELEEQARNEAKRSNALIEKAKQSARDALEYQKKAGKEAADSYQALYDAEAKADAEEAAFNKMSDADKAATRRQQAAALQAKADADLANAKQLAYTDIEAANELAQQAMDEAEQARQFLLDAADLEKAVADAAAQAALEAAQGTGASEAETGGTVVNLDPVQAAAIAYGDYADLYDMGVAAAAGGSNVQFNQYNTSPEALNPTEVYRLTNNQLNAAGNKLTPAA